MWPEVFTLWGTHGLVHCGPGCLLNTFPSQSTRPQAGPPTDLGSTEQNCWPISWAWVCALSQTPSSSHLLFCCTGLQLSLPARWISVTCWAHCPVDTLVHRPLSTSLQLEKDLLCSVSQHQLWSSSFFPEALFPCFALGSWPCRFKSQRHNLHVQHTWNHSVCLMVFLAQTHSVLASSSGLTVRGADAC